MGSVQNKLEQRRSRKRFAISDSSVSPPGIKEPFLFATEPKCKSRDIIMYHVYSITETTIGETKSVAIDDLVNVCSDISSVKRVIVNGIV